ncbi:MAG: hypothetical protein RLZZ230_791, partial [Candidatus Parcubacteria bacterium]
GNKIFVNEEKLVTEVPTSTASTTASTTEEVLQN